MLRPIPSPVAPPSDPIGRVLLRADDRAGLPARGAEGPAPEAGVALGEAVDAAQDGTPQQDVDPGVQDLVPGGQPDPQLHQVAVVHGVGAQGPPPRLAH